MYIAEVRKQIILYIWRVTLYLYVKTCKSGSVSNISVIWIVATLLKFAHWQKFRREWHGGTVPLWLSPLKLTKSMHLTILVYWCNLVIFFCSLKYRYSDKALFLLKKKCYSISSVNTTIHYWRMKTNLVICL